MQAKYINKATDLAKFFIEQALKPGDAAVDATVGNGNDILFLSRLVEGKGKIYGFDIQENAISKTYNKLTKYGFQENVHLIHDSHEKLDFYVKEKVKAIMFNLGYLPGGDHTVTTKESSSKIAIKKGLDLLDKNGLMTVAVYTGHSEGEKEKETILSYCCEIDQNYFNVLKLEFINQKNNPPFLLVIEKK